MLVAKDEVRNSDKVKPGVQKWHWTPEGTRT